MSKRSIRTQILVILFGSFASATPILQQSYAKYPSPVISNDDDISITAVDCAALPPAIYVPSLSVQSVEQPICAANMTILSATSLYT
ncbi:hypothetical protein GPALN_007416 [Globodera pallida]|nr:hypothetical protein GPALN_007416 [Globodera pallida]